VIRAYLTVSDEAALVLAYMPPADLIAQERLRLRRRRTASTFRSPADVFGRDEGDGERGDSSAVAATVCLLTQGPVDVRSWVRRLLPRILLTFRITQALSGLGCFQYYLHRMRRAINPLCVQCGSAVDTAEHTLLACPYWEPFRAELVGRVGHRLSVATICGIICDPTEEDLPPDSDLNGSIIEEATESMRLLYKMVEGLLSAKEKEERVRQADAAVGQNGRLGRRDASGQ